MKREKAETIIDAIQTCLVYWEKNDKGKIKTFLEDSNLSSSEIFWQYAQAISEVLPDGDKEKQMLQGFLYGKKSFTSPGEKTVTLMDYGSE